jgi:hypothetical protein
MLLDGKRPLFLHNLNVVNQIPIVCTAISNDLSVEAASTKKYPEI